MLALPERGVALRAELDELEAEPALDAQVAVA